MRPVVYPADYMLRDPPPPLEQYARRLLAEGDSWFTIGTLNLPRASNVLFTLEFQQTVAIVNCAYPGHTLHHMVDNLHDPYFDRLLRAPRFASYWEAILISGGGNDLIDAAAVGPVGSDGQAVPGAKRLLLTPAEAAAQGSADQAPSYVSEAGWSALAGYLRSNFIELVARRDQGPSAGRPLFTHTYATPTVRASGTVGAKQGWLHPAMEKLGIPLPVRQPLAELLFGRLRALLLELDQDSGLPGALPQVHVFDSAALSTIVPASPGATGISGDWVNEIHLLPEGYKKMGLPFGQFIDQTLARYPG